jgi:hypothetical protein
MLKIGKWHVQQYHWQLPLYYIMQINTWQQPIKKCLVVFGFAQRNLPPLKIERTAIFAASITSTVVARRLLLAYTWDSVNSLLISDIIRLNWFRTRGMLSYHTSTVGFLEGCWNKNTHLGFSFFLQCTHSLDRAQNVNNFNLKTDSFKLPFIVVSLVVLLQNVNFKTSVMLLQNKVKEQ